MISSPGLQSVNATVPSLPENEARVRREFVMIIPPSAGKGKKKAAAMSMMDDFDEDEDDDDEVCHPPT